MMPSTYNAINNGEMRKTRWSFESAVAHLIDFSCDTLDGDEFGKFSVHMENDGDKDKVSGTRMNGREYSLKKM